MISTRARVAISTNVNRFARSKVGPADLESAAFETRYSELRGLRVSRGVRTSQRDSFVKTDPVTSETFATDSAGSRV